MDKLKKETIHTCVFCGKSFINEEEAEKHLESCLLNVVDNSTCVTCKYVVVNKQPMTAKDNGYNSYRLREFLGTKDYLTCGKGIYSGKMVEDKILRENKGCFERADFDDPFEVFVTDEYKKWEEKSQKAVDGQQELNKEMVEEKQKIAKYKEELEKQGLSEEEIANKISEMFDE